MTQKIGKRQPAPYLTLSADLDDVDEYNGPSILVRRPTDLDAVADHSQHCITVESDLVTRPILEAILQKLRRYPDAELRFEDTSVIQALQSRRKSQDRRNAWAARANRAKRKAAANAGK